MNNYAFCRSLTAALLFGFLTILLSLDIQAQDTEVALSAASRQSGDAEKLSMTEVRAALRRLEANELQVRDAAEKQLLEMGVAVLPFLPEVTSRTSGELKVRLQRIREALRSSDIESYFEASTVTIHGKMQLSEAISQISDQTNNAITLQNSEGLQNVEVELSADDAPFWTVMNSLMTQARLRVNAFGTTESELVLGTNAADPAQQPPVFTSGPFRLDVTSVQTTLPFTAAMGGTLDLSFQVTWEPRLKPIFMQLPMSSVSAELLDGSTLTAGNPQATPEIPLNLGGCSTQVDLQLTRPPREEKAIRKLTGEFVIAVPSDRHDYVFEKFGNGARQSEKYGDVNVTLEGARHNGAVYEMRIFVEFGDSQGALDSFRGWILSNQAYLLGPQKNRLENVGLQTYAIRPNAVGIAYLFQINGDPDQYQLVYESPASISRQKVQYELKDIALP